MWAAEVYRWPPSVVRAQTERDLMLLAEARAAASDDF